MTVLHFYVCIFFNFMLRNCFLYVMKLSGTKWEVDKAIFLSVQHISVQVSWLCFSECRQQQTTLTALQNSHTHTHTHTHTITNQKPETTERFSAVTELRSFGSLFQRTKPKWLKAPSPDLDLTLGPVSETFKYKWESMKWFKKGEKVKQKKNSAEL